MERKKRVSVGVVLMGFFLFFVMLGALAGLVTHEVLLREATSGMSGERETFTVIGALHILLELTYKGGESWVSILGANARDFIVIGLMFVGIVMFIVAGFTKNHIVYLISLLLTGTSVFMKRLPALISDIRYFPSMARAGSVVSTYNTTRFIVDFFIILAWIFILVVWLLSIIKDGKVKKGTGDPDKSLVIGFIPGVLMILAYVSFCSYEAIAVASGDPEMSAYVLSREYGSAWIGVGEVEIFGSLALVLRYLFLSFQFSLLILFTGLWLNHPYKKLSTEEKAARLAEEKKSQAPQPAAAAYGTQYGAQYGQPYGAPYGQQMNPQYGQQYGQPVNPQYTPQYGQPVNPQYAPQYGQPADPQYTSQYGQPYGAPYGQQMNPQYGQPAAPLYEQPAAPQFEQPEQASYAKAYETPVIPVPVPVPVQEEPVKEEAAEVFEEVKEEAAEKFEEVKEEIPAAVEEAPLFFAEAKEQAADHFEEVKEETAEAFEEVKEEASETFEEFKEEAAEKFEEVKEEAAEKFEEVKEEIPAAVEEDPLFFAEAKEQAAEAVPVFKFCPNCGFPLEGAGRFCPSCGFKLHD